MDNAQSSQAAAPRVLVVDDEPTIRSVVVDALALDGYEICQASDGAEARALLSEAPADLVITDLEMPGLTGLGLMAWAREEGMKAAWIILSGRGTFDDAIRAVQLGAFDFITKPMQLASLRVAARNAIRQRRLTAEGQRLRRHLEDRNERLRGQVRQLQEACGLLCDQAETIGQDLARAELIQRALLPQAAPPMADLAVDAVYRPSHNVGGDVYEIARADERHVIAYIADAAGHGVSAAMLAVLFKHRIAALDARGRPRAPSEVLASVNEALRGECGAPGLFITVAYCLLDTQSRELIVASAGHTPLLLHRAAGEIETVYHTGPALGLAPRATFAQKRIVLAPGDRLLLYTDGLYDTPDVRQSLTVDQMAEILQSPETPTDGQAVLHRLLDASRRRRGDAPQKDDITMLLLTAAAAPSTLDNGTPTPVHIAQPMRAAKAQVLAGRTGGASAFSIEGRATWEYCTAFHEACAAEIAAGRGVTLDLSLCEHMDSTFLGTVQELAQRADRSEGSFRVQGALPPVRALFEELGMDAVLAHVAPGMLPLPARMTAVDAWSEDDDRNRRRILTAHEALAGLNDRNRQEFLRVIEGVRKELALREQPPPTRS